MSKFCVVGTLLFLFIACDNSERTTTDHQRLRGVLAQLNKLHGGDIYFTLLINGISTGARYGVTGQETRIPLSDNDLRSGENSIRVEFYFKSSDADEILIADSVQSVDRNQDNVITLVGLEYQYTDSDRDSIINAHELMQVDDNPDQDSFPNYLDADSDGDGVNDGVDFTPYGVTTTDSDSNTLMSFSYESLSGVTSRIDIGSIASDSGVLGLLTEDQLVSEFVPPSWPMSSLPMADLNTRWTAIEVSAGGNASCPDWRISRDASSISSRLSKPAFGVFQRSDDTVVLIPILTGDIADLTLYRSDNTLDGDETVDNSLIAMLVTPNTAGWLSLYTKRNYSGEPCYLNVTFPRIN